MEKKQLIKTLEGLHAELANAESIDDETRAMLATLTQDIQRLSSDDGSQSVEPVSDQVQDRMLKFETDHPRLTRALNQVATALANLGI